MVGYNPSSIRLRRSLFERWGPFDANRRHAAVIAWIERARELGLREVVLPEVLVRRRLHTDNLSQLGLAEAHDEYLALVNARLDRRRRQC